MTRYRTLALDRGGQTMVAFIDAPSVDAAAAELVARGVTPIDIRSGAPSLVERLRQPVVFGSSVSRGGLALLTEQLATLMKAGLPLERALDLIAGQSISRSSRALVARLLEAVRGGGSFSDALAIEAAVPVYYTGVARAAERSGRLREGLADLAETLRRSEAVRLQLIASLTYPAIVLLTSVGALLVVLLAVIPEFEPVFAGEEHRLPTLTRAVLALSRLVNQHGGTLIIALLAAASAVALAARRPAMRETLRALASRAPGANLIRHHSAARLLRVLGSMLANGVPLADALDLTRGASGRLAWRGLALDAAARVREGWSLSAALARHPRFPAAAAQLIEVGEESGDLARMCLHAADLIEMSTRARVDRLVAIANPLAVILLGGLVALLIMGVMLGIFSINELAT